MPTLPPNILLLFTDDQRFDTIGALWSAGPGRLPIRTPHLDRLAARGTAFTRAHIPGGTTGAVCMPSRAMLHTGRTLFHLQDVGQEIPADHVLLGEHLRRCGYVTFGVGKWHNGPSAYGRSFLDGAEIFFGGMNDHWNVPVCRFDPTGRYDCLISKCVEPFTGKSLRRERCDHVTPGKHSSELFADAAIDFLSRHDAARPFFAYVSFMAPHDPRVMPAAYRQAYVDREMQLPPNCLPEHPFDYGIRQIRDELLAPYPRTDDVVREHLADYCAMISHLDTQIGRVLDALDQRGLTDNTLIVMAGDNGLALGQHGLFGKQSLYEHSIRVPLVFAGPGIPQGQRRDQLVYLLDIYPTLCGLCALDVPGSVEGMDLRAAMRDPTGIARPMLYLAYEKRIRGTSDGDYKLIEYRHAGQRHVQLFDLQADPWEQQNLASDPAAAATLARLDRQMHALADQWGDRGTRFGQAFWQGG